MKRRVPRGTEKLSARKSSPGRAALYDAVWGEAGRGRRGLIEPLEQRTLLSGNDVLFGGVDFASTDSAQLSNLNTVLTNGSGQVSLQATVNVLNQHFDAYLAVSASGPISSPQFTISATHAFYTLSDSGGNSLVSCSEGVGTFT